MENERTCEFRFWCVNGEDEDMWVALGLICRRFAGLELRKVEEDVRNLQRQHLGCGRILVFCRSVSGFLVIDGEEDDLVVVEASSGAVSGGEEWRFAICSIGVWWTILWWRLDDSAAGTTMMEVQQKREDAFMVARDALERTTADEHGSDGAGWCGS
ncbi:hypothetical protein LR48_Vigan05g051900 [Vigna angularis]|uniref:Uncharacterized protein n=1 Tax=Phaseolus angularis TaxID=3914 RepID=A0A0L9UJ41_PHAAN|nr:hypothetical protein LR48_Vigan05g051900 [Vigna angularis]